MQRLIRQRFFSAGLLLALAGAAQASDLPRDLPGSRDLPALPRFANSAIIGYRTEEFARSEMPAGRWGGSPGKPFWERSIALEGQRTRILYLAPSQASSLEIIKQARQALEKLGYRTLFECSGFQECGKEVADFYTDPAHGKQLADSHLLKHAYAGDSVREPRLQVARLQRPDLDSCILIFAAFQDNYADSDAGNRVAVFVEEILGKPPPPAPRTVLDASALAREIRETGRAAMPGIRFAFNQAGILPESRPQLEQLARLLNEQPELAAYVVAHTDNQGDLEFNLDLSRRCATEVVRSLIGDYGISGERLTPMGIAGLAPLVSNASEEGRLRNRRVELVAK